MQKLNSSQFSAQLLATNPQTSRPPTEAPVVNNRTESPEVVSKWTKFLPPDSDSTDDDDPVQLAMRPLQPQRPYKPPKSSRKRTAPLLEDTPTELPMPLQTPVPEPEVVPPCPAKPDRHRFSLQTSATAVRSVPKPNAGNKWGKFLANEKTTEVVSVAAVKTTEVEPPRPKVNKWSSFLPAEQKKAPVKEKSSLPAYLSTDAINDDEFDALFTL